VQLDPTKPALTAPESKPLNLQYDEVLSSFAFKFNLRRCIEDHVYAAFSRSVGVANIREYEETALALLQRAGEERARFTQQRAKLTVGRCSLTL
jgi:structural maintenance of chromosome 1